MANRFRRYALVIPVLTAGCSHLTLDSAAQNALLVNEKDCLAIVSHGDGGSPSIVRALAKGCYCTTDSVLRKGSYPRIDAGIPCE